MITKRLCSLASVCFLCFTFKFTLAQRKSANCPAFRDTILHKLVYKVVDKAPEVKGGIQQFYKKLSKNLRYPTGDIDYHGKVVVAFVVEPNGKIDGKRTIYDPSGKQRLFSKQILNIVDMVIWIPGLCNGRPVPVLYTLPVRIDIAE